MVSCLTTTSYGYNNQSALSSLAHDLAGTAQDNTWTYGRNQAQEITNHAWTLKKLMREYPDLNLEMMILSEI